MIRINLLPIRQLRKRIRTRNEVFVFVISFVSVLAVLGIVGFSLSHKISTLNTEISALQQKKASYQPILNQIAQLKKNKEILEKKVDVIKKLKQGSQLTVRILDEIANRAPTSRLWLKSLKENSGQLQLTGVALDNATIAQFMKQLSDSPYFLDAELANSSQEEVAGRKLKSFSLTVKILTPSQQVESTSGEKKS